MITGLLNAMDIKLKQYAISSFSDLKTSGDECVKLKGADAMTRTLVGRVGPTIDGVARDQPLQVAARLHGGRGPVVAPAWPRREGPEVLLPPNPGLQGEREALSAGGLAGATTGPILWVGGTA